MSKESEHNREGFGSHKQRHEGGMDPQAKKYRDTTLSKQGPAEGEGAASETIVDEAGRASPDMLARQGRKRPEDKRR